MRTLREPFIQTISITMPSRLGFHLRVVAQFVQCVQEFRSTIRVRNGKLCVDGKSILGLLVLGAAWKSKLDIEAVGDDALQAIEGIEAFFLDQKNRNDPKL